MCVCVPRLYRPGAQWFLKDEMNHKTEARCHIPLSSQYGRWTINPFLTVISSSRFAGAVWSGSCFRFPATREVPSGPQEPREFQ